MKTQESWDNWRAHVLAEIERANVNLSNINSAVNTLNVEIGKLQVKSGVWGMVGGIIPVIILVLIEKMK